MRRRRLEISSGSGWSCRTSGCGKVLSRVLLAFNTGEQYLALGLGKPDALAFIASEAGYGDFEELRTFYACLPQDYDGKLPAASEPRIRPAHDNLDLQDSASLRSNTGRIDPHRRPSFGFEAW